MEEMAASRLRKKDVIWEKLFDRYDILQQVNANGYFDITSQQINGLEPGVQARLQCKFDSSGELSPCFARHGLGILPVSNGHYTIARFPIFHPLEDIEKLPVHRAYWRFPAFETVQADGSSSTSEANALHTAHMSDMLHRFRGLEPAEPLELTFSGRMRSPAFSFHVGSYPHPLQVERSQQMEIDAGFESNREILILEAKNSIPQDFCVRQLYYPYRALRSRPQLTKPVIPIYFLYSDGVYYLFEYSFRDPMRYDSLALVRAGAYRIEGGLSKERVLAIAEATPAGAEPEGVPFPQANSFERIINLLELLEEEDLLKSDIERLYRFDKRQSDYYANAGVYLDLAETCRTPEGTAVRLTGEGRTLMQLTVQQRHEALLRKLFARPAIRDILLASLARGEPIPELDAMNMMHRHGIELNPSTQHRRAQSILAWYGWLVRLMG
ncbi:type II restriction enzyme [Paenibacillus dendritiformis]|uniref:type II restriction enzyme n=1 Tax=Paenibacillus dendritiformis TaxID=130049 RepID=UPI00387E1C1B